jgi:hypothetical protein
MTTLARCLYALPCSVLLTVTGADHQTVSLATSKGPRHQGPVVELTELYSLQLPDSFRLAGAAISTRGLLLLWSANVSYLILVSDRSISRVPTPGVRGPIAASFAGSDTLIEIVTLAPPAIVQLTGMGSVVARHRLAGWSDSLALETAAPLDDGWLIGGVTADRGYRIVHVRKSGGDTTVVRLPPGRLGQPPRISFQMTDLDGRVLLSSPLPPFSVAELTGTRAMRVLIPQSALVSTGVIKPTDTSSYWIALRMVPLDTGYIQSFADLKSDRRILAVYTRTFSPISHVITTVPLGMMASIPRRKRLIAARNIGGTVEIVVYQWRWTGA